MSRGERHRLILDRILASGSVTAGELSELTGRSLMTVHRDLEELAHLRLIRKFRGGASALPTSVFESSSDFRLHRRSEAKAALAGVARTFIEPGMAILLDDSTTVLALARLLHDVAPLTVVSNYRQVVEELRDVEDVDVIVVGGTYSRTHDSFIGPPDQTNADAYAVDIAFQSTSTMDAEMTYHQEQDVVSMKRVMLRGGRRRVLMMDGSKVGHTSLHRFAAVSEFTDVILTDDAPQDIRDTIADQVRVHVVTVTGEYSQQVR